MTDVIDQDQLKPAVSGLDLYRRLLRYIVPYRSAFIASILSMALFAMTDTGFAALMKPMLDGSFVERDPESIRLIPVMLIGLFVLRGITGFISTYCMIWVGRNIVRDLRGNMFNHMLELPVTFFEGTSSGQLLSKMTYDVEQVAQAATNVITIMVRDTLTVIGLLAWMFYISWRLALLVIVITPIVAFVIRYVSRRFRRISQSIQDSMAGITQRTGEMIDGQRIVKLNGGQMSENQRFSADNNWNRKQHMKIASTTAASAPILQLLLAVVLSAIIMMATSNALEGKVSVGGFMSFIVAMMMMMAPIKRLTTVNSALQKGIVAARSIFGLIDQPAEIDEGEQRLENTKGHICYKEVTFQYDTSNRPALKHINLEIKPGESVAFVGRSGSGKSTLVSLLPRFYPMQKGVITIDDLDIRSIDLKNLRKNIALVSQDITLFNASIKDNIAYGTDADDETILNAAKMAHAWEFINELPDKMETTVGEDGVLLSGGQRQRLAIARAFLKDAPILILDEATSALDSESEKYIQESLSQLMQQRTTLVIAHRLSTVEKVDRIFVMENGSIVEQGSHQELLQKEGHYARLHALQQSEEASPKVV